ncbi:MAG: capsular biosynthesis protein [Lachnospiraceae bacterium]|nr:capsular biosynthesis protein [Lachnospiraceae bacterium]
MNKFMRLFKKVGGKDVLKQYLRAHVFLFACVQALLLGFSKKSLEILRLAVSNKILKKLRKKYRKFIEGYVAAADNKDLQRVKSNKVWVCWFQGIEQAPYIVKKCYQSLQDNLKDKEIILLTDDNYRDYVTFPNHVQEKIDKGYISKTHMSDLLRLELLANYGGTWIDATVFLSGDNYPDYIFDSDLFLFQDLKPGLDGHPTCISSWFMTATTNNPIILLTRDLLYEYWRKNKSLIDYFLVHDMFQLAIETYPEEWDKNMPFSNSLPHILLLRMFDKYEEKTWEAIKNQTAVHKMTYKFDEKDTLLEGTYYHVIFKEG